MVKSLYCFRKLIYPENINVINRMFIYHEATWVIEHTTTICTKTICSIYKENKNLMKYEDTVVKSGNNISSIDDFFMYYTI